MSTDDMQKGTHRIYGGSNCSRWWECPGSIRMTKNILSQGASIHAAEGTVAHELAEKFLKSGVLRDDSWVGEIIEQDDFKIKVTEDMIDHIEIYTSYVFNELNEAQLDPKIHLLTELPVPLKRIPNNEAGGSIDALIYNPFNSIQIIDLKFGRGVSVEAFMNKQLLFYAAGLLDYDIFDFEEVILTIVQPRCPHSDGPIRSYVVTRGELEAFYDELVRRVKATKDPEAPIKSGSHCRWCPAYPFCKGPSTVTLGGKQLEVQNVKTLPDPNRMNHKDIHGILEKADVIKSWLEGIGAKALELALDGLKFPGWKVVKKYGHRAWTNENWVVENLGPVLGEGELYAEPVLQPPSVLEKKIKKALKKDKNLKETVLSGITDNCEKPERGFALVPSNSAGEEYNPENDIENMFQPIKGE